MLYTLVGFIALVVMIVIVNSVFNTIDFISRCETRKDYAREWHRLSWFSRGKVATGAAIAILFIILMVFLFSTLLGYILLCQ